MISPKITNLGYSTLWADMSTILGYASTFDQQIQKLFANGEQGFWYDPNDIGTMFQDAGGTIPVTAEGQPVGLIRDKSGRNNHAYQTTSASRPILRKNAVTGANYLEFDGTDDSLATSNIDFTATDKVSLFAGVRKLSDAAIGFIVELSTSADQAINQGSFYVRAPFATDGSFGVSSRGSQQHFTTTPSEYPAPISTVLTTKMTSKFSTRDEAINLRINANHVIGTGNADRASEGNYGNYPLFIGRRSGTTFPFNGHIYSLIGIGRLTTDVETKALEKLIAKNTGVTLNV